MFTALIIEDIEVDRIIFTSYLKTIGWEAVVVSNGEEALTYLNNYQPNIIFLDVVLPGRSGFEICRTIKSQVDLQKIPVVICSTKDTDMDRYWGLKQGADFYLSKPVSQNEFLAALQKLVH